MDINNIINKVLNEYTNPYGTFAKYEGEDITFDSVYDKAEHLLIQGLKQNKHYSSAHDLMDELYNVSTLNEADFETAYDACEEAIANVYFNNDINENTIKLAESELKYIIAEATKRIVTETYRDSRGRMWSLGGNTPRDGMTGGSWGSKRVYGVYKVDIDNIIELIDEETYSDELYDKLKNIDENLYFNVEADYAYDDSVGMSEGFYDIKVDETPCMKAIQNLSLFRGDEINELKKVIISIAHEVKNNQGEDVDFDLD